MSKDSIINVFLCIYQPMNEGHDGEAPGFDIPIFTEEFLDHNKGNLLIVNIR